MPFVGSDVAKARVAAVHRAIDRLDVSGLDGGEYAVVLKELERAKRRLEAASLKLLAAADRDRVGERTGHPGTGSWASEQTKCGGAEGSAQAQLATDLDERLPETGKSLDSGEISSEHAKLIAATMRCLPDGVSVTEREAIEQHLVSRAREVDPVTLRRLARRALAAAERSCREVDAHEDELLRTEEQRALARTRLSMHDNADGTTTGHFTVPTSAASILRKAVQQIASPRRDRARQERGLPYDGVADGTRTYAQSDWAHRYGLALLEILEHLPTERLHGKVAATVVVTIPLESLQTGIGAAQLDTGHAVSAEEARRIACGAGILPAVLGGRSLPIDVGRTDRFFTETQRVALATLYRECAEEHCDRPYAWSELHHEDPWSEGGRTDLDRAVPLCGFHHRRVHDPRYAAQIHTDESGRKVLRLRQR